MQNFTAMDRLPPFVAVVFVAIVSPGQSNFHCGDFHSPKAKSGLRWALTCSRRWGGVSELGADGWHWVCLDGEFPNSKSAGLVKSLTDCSQLKRCTDVFVMFLLIPNLTSWSTRSHIWLCSKIPMAFLFRARKRHQGGRWDTVALLSLGCTASRGQPCCGLVGTEADETWKYGIFPKLI